MASSCKLLAAASLIAVALWSNAATAQGGNDQRAPDENGQNASDEAIIVTGSRISRQDYVAQSPIVTTDKVAIENSGVPTADAYLLQLPQFQPGAGSFTNASSGGLGIGQATLNLRGLGAVRTLVLLDGRRLQPGNAQSVIDINTIPTSAIGGVEVITGGASATYGSDAIAGVVNFKLRKRFNGLEASGQIGVSDRGDAPTHQFSFIGGQEFAGGDGSFMIAGEYADRAAIAYRERAFSNPTGNLASQTMNGYYAPTGSNLPSQAAVDSLFGSYGYAAGTMPRTGNFGVNVDDTLFRSSAPGTNYKDFGDPCIVNNGATGFGYDGQCTNNLQTSLRRYAALARAEYRVTPDVNLFAQFIYAHSFARGEGSHPQAIPFGTAGLSIPITNPFIPDDLRTVLASRANPDDDFIYVKRITQAGPRAYTSSTDTYQALVGAEGKISSIGWDYEVYYSHGHMSALDKGVSGNVSNSALQQLLSAPDGGASLCAGGFNIFGPTEVSDSCIDFISRSTRTTTDIGQDEIAANVSGSLFTLPAGEAKLALSANYRRNSYATNPDTAVQAGDIAAVVAVQPISGNISVVEGAVELFVPILADVPMFQSLNLTGGYRYSRYKPGGGVSTYKVNFDWRVIDPILLRGGYQRAVRAPNIGELFQPASGVIANLGAPPTAGDPCDVRSSFRSGSNASSVRSLCLAQGIPESIIDSYNQANVAAPSITQGNRDLKPERAESFTIGAIIQPRFLGGAFERMSLSIDYYNIKIHDTIGSLGVQPTFNKCFNGDGSNPDYSQSNYYCSLITRNAQNGQISQAIQPLLNLGGYKTDGIDMQFDWTLPLDALGVRRDSKLVFNLTANYLNSFEIQNLPSQPFQDFTGIIGGSDVYARWKLAGSVTYEQGPVQVGARWRHLSSFRDVSIVTNPTSTVQGPGQFDYVDLFTRISVNEHFEFRLGVTNVGDRQPPQVGGLKGFTNPGVYDVIGRAYYAGVKTKF